MKKSTLLQHVSDFKDQVKGLRETIHACPETGFEEYETAGLITETLREFGCTAIRTGLLHTGVLATIQGGHPGPVIMLRVDMDALENMDDVKQVPYASVNKGICHACGHDVHTALGLGVAGILMRNQSDLHGTARIFFQPSEEKPFRVIDQPAHDRYTEPPVGLRSAWLALREGILDNPSVDRLLGVHCWPSLEAGKVGYQYGPAMAGTGNFHLAILGRSGHAGLPQEGIDAVAIASQLVSAMQVAFSRRVDPNIALTLNVGTIRGGTRRSVIAERVDMAGTFRCADAGLLSEGIRPILEEVVSNTCRSMGGDYLLDYGVDQPPVINDRRVVSESAAVMKEFLGEEAVELTECAMTGDDFSFLSSRVPGLYLKLGTSGSDPATQFPLHSPSFDVDPACYQAGLLAISSILLDYLKAFED